jgi:cyclophilin family peptidyl-prolyl cis-trans isomerase
MEQEMAVAAARGLHSPAQRRRFAGWDAFRRLSIAMATARSLAQRSQFVITTVLPVIVVLWTAPTLHGGAHRRKIAPENYGLVFSTEVSSPESEVLQAVEAIVNNGIIQGSKEYSKDRYIENASVAASSPLFPEWKEPGKVYYKIRTGVLAPLNFRDSKDEGTLAVRYVVQGKDPSKTILRIDAVFVEDFHRTMHASDGSVESAECQEIENQIDAVETQKKQDLEREKQRLDKSARQDSERKHLADEQSALAVSQSSAQTLDQRLETLRRQAERVVKAPGGQLKSAPFHSATNVKSLEAGAEVVILIVTPYWYGVETTDGQHGWLNREQLEPLP